MPAKLLRLSRSGRYLYKRRGSRSIRITVTPNGQVKVSLPYWVPYASGVAFVRSKQDWIAQQRSQPPALLRDGQAVGKRHRLLLQASATATKPSGRLRDDTIIVSHPAQLADSAAAVQDAAQRAIIRALRQEAELALPRRLHDLATAHHFTYKSVSVKQLKRRWGSCDQHHNIVCNLFLMQLPWDLIDYVLLHELTHTEHLDHSAAFWAKLTAVLPDARVRRQQLRHHAPDF